MFAQKRLQSHVQMSSEIHNRPTLHEAENYKIPKTTESQAAEMAHHYHVSAFPENPASIPHPRKQLTTTCNFTSADPMPDLLKHLHSSHAHTHIELYTHLLDKKYF